LAPKIDRSKNVPRSTPRALQFLLGPPRQPACFKKQCRGEPLSSRVSAENRIAIGLGFCRRSAAQTLFDRSGSAAIHPVTAVAAPTIPAAPIRTSMRAISSPPGRAPVPPHDRCTDWSPATTPIAAPPHRRTGGDDRPGNDGHRGRCDSRRRHFSSRWRGRDLKIRRMSRHERHRHER
jgi:hypothetical protein